MKLPVIKLTPAQQLILNGILSLLATAIVGAVSATYQYYGEHALNIGSLINFMLLTFLVLFGKALHDYVPAHAQQLIQALQDSVQQGQTAVDRAFDHIEHMQDPMLLQAAPAIPLAAQSQQGPLIVIHNAAPITTQPTQPMISQTADTQPSVQNADPMADPPALTSGALTHVTGPLPGTTVTYTGAVPANTTTNTGSPAAPAGEDYQGDTWTRVQAAQAAQQAKQ